MAANKDKQRILGAIARTARKLGRAPTFLEFIARREVSRYAISKCFPKWNDAVRAAGLQPYRLRVRPDDSELLEDWGRTVRDKGGLVTRNAYRHAGKHEPRTLEKRFGEWTGVTEAFRRFAKGKPEWADVVALLPDPVPRSSWRPAKRAAAILPNHGRHAPLKEGTIYGRPLDFRGLRHEPVNEQGVVLLFGMLARELGYLVEAVQKEFPDCEAKRKIGSDRWQRVSIEFEFESRNFRDHGHPAGGCDVIVCWRHNWDECPAEIEVLELSGVVKALASAGN
jgi:hypothetical protein